ncbi:hypothetical protein J5N97_025524 [Dioscorea zingiberensis]|uniref:RING-type domain-containing protein n=1 Tax=Dioscorea zingiberensis TaxID=325984 RepID=A0A9D5C9L6_9LILI|nr:hypothetical protein J5N97_025524 [Dioscorea zingiberensis]
MPIPNKDALLGSEYPSIANTTSTKNNSSNNKWGPYSGAGDFSTSMVLVLGILICTLFLALIVVAFIRIILSNRRNRLQEKKTVTETAEKEEPVPTLIFSAGTKLAGVGAECAICLTEFIEGDGVRVLPACNHGFHLKCIEGWLASHCSCPTCRRSCRVPPTDLQDGKSSVEMV